MPENHGFSFRERGRFIQPHPDGISHGIIVSVPVSQRPAVNEQIIRIAAADFKIDRQCPDDVEHFLPIRFGAAQQTRMRNIAAVAIPAPDVFVFRRCFRQRVQHHVFMIAQQHGGVGHKVQFLQDFQPEGIAVNAVAQHIQMIVPLQVDLTHDAFVSAVMPVNIGQNIDHARLSLQSNAKQTRRSCGCRSRFSAMRFSSAIPD